jgi:PAS domain S-box-containing protein
MRVLILDDDPDTRALVARVLKQEFGDLELVEIIDEAAFEAALQFRAPDLVVTDYDLRWTDGLSVFRTARAAFPDCPVIMFTGTGNEEVAVEAMKAGLDDYIVKSQKQLRRLGPSARAAVDRASQRRALNLAEARYRDLFRSVPVGLYRCEPDGTFAAANPALLEMLGFENERQLTGANFQQMIAPAEMGGRTLPLNDSAQQEEPWTAEVRILRRDGRELWAMNSVHVVSDQTGPVRAYEGALTDVTAQRTLLEEKSLLLEELYHRVHNNLQIIISLLSSAARQIEDPVAREHFADVSQRVQSLALVQERLYRAGNLKRIAFHGYLEDLARGIIGTDQRVTLALDLAELELSIDQAAPLGLIANELILNALKHAFAAGSRGVIRVSLRVESDGRAILEIENNGVGPGGSSAEAGLRLVRRLATQLGAEVVSSAGQDGGTRATVRFAPWSTQVS